MLGAVSVGAGRAKVSALRVERLDKARADSGRAAWLVARTALLDCIGELIELADGGQVTKRYLTELRVPRERGALARDESRQGGR